MITLQNLHFHSITIHVLKNQQFVERLKLDSLKKSNFNFFDNFDMSALYAIICDNCNEIFNDYNSNYFFNHSNIINPQKVGASLFYNKAQKHKYNYIDLTVFEFVELNNVILLGTKNEIIFYICKEFNTLQNDYSSIKLEKNNLKKQKLEKERSIDEMGNQLEIEKKNRKIRFKFNI